MPYKVHKKYKTTHVLIFYRKKNNITECFSFSISCAISVSFNPQQQAQNNVVSTADINNYDNNTNPNFGTTNQMYQQNQR